METLGVTSLGFPGVALYFVCGQGYLILTHARDTSARRRGLHNITYVCESVLSDECIAQYGPAGCWIAAMTAMADGGHGAGASGSGSGNTTTNTTGSAPSE